MSNHAIVSLHRHLSYMYIYILAQVIRYQSEILADFRTMGKRIALINREAT